MSQKIKSQFLTVTNTEFNTITFSCQKSTIGHRDLGNLDGTKGLPNGSLRFTFGFFFFKFNLLQTTQNISTDIKRLRL